MIGTLPRPPTGAPALTKHLRTQASTDSLRAGKILAVKSA